MRGSSDRRQSNCEHRSAINLIIKQVRAYAKLSPTCTHCAFHQPPVTAPLSSPGRKAHRALRMPRMHKPAESFPPCAHQSETGIQAALDVMPSSHLPKWSCVDCVKCLVITSLQSMYVASRVLREPIWCLRDQNSRCFFQAVPRTLVGDHMMHAHGPYSWSILAVNQGR